MTTLRRTFLTPSVAELRCQLGRFSEDIFVSVESSRYANIEDDVACRSGRQPRAL